MSGTDPVSTILFFLTTGLFIGAGHCLGMCGPVVVAISLNLPDGKTMGPHLGYHAGRIVTYGVLGGVMGATGAFLGFTSAVMNLQKGLLAATGLTLVVMGMGMMGWLPRLTRWMDVSVADTLFSGVLKRLVRRRSVAGFFLLGLVLGFLPCGPVYTALLAVAGAGMKTGGPAESALRGVIQMAAFGLGTAPPLLLLGKLAQTRIMKRRMMLYRAGALLIMLFGAVLTVQAIRF